MKVTVAQLNPVVGDVEGNLKKITNALEQCSRDSGELLVLPELFLVGYPPKDLLERQWFISKVKKGIEEIKHISKNYPEIGILVGAPTPTGKDIGRGLYNSAVFICNGEELFTQHKSLLPTYDVFDETRYFDTAYEVHVVSFKGEKLGISICEDIWNDPEIWLKRNYPFDPIKCLAEKGATLFINLSGSPYHVGKEEIRYSIVSNHARKHGIPFVFVNQVGANDDLIFDGNSMCVDKTGELLEAFPAFEERIKTVDLSLEGGKIKYISQEEIESVHDALVLGVQDYMKKCGFKKAVVGLSGGMDSALTCCIAKEAIGSENVLAVAMPSPYSSKESVDHSIELAKNLGIELKIISISSLFQSYIDSLKEHLKSGDEVDVALENIQARIRGNILMALSNEAGYLVLSTGNKSELSVGYCTLYGDMTGGLAVISDVPKTMVYKLAEYINRDSEIIPNGIIEKAPSAELKPDQKDEDTLPPYDILDKILYCYVHEAYSIKGIIDLGFDPEIVKWVVRAVDRNEYKRRQGALGLRVTSKAFGVGRRMPIAARYEI
jgi:NAD+ synthase (glutamine-hydrolysing)